MPPRGLQHACDTNWSIKTCYSMPKHIIKCKQLQQMENQCFKKAVLGYTIFEMVAKITNSTCV